MGLASALAAQAANQGPPAAYGAPPQQYQQGGYPGAAPQQQPGGYPAMMQGPGPQAAAYPSMAPAPYPAVGGAAPPGMPGYPGYPPQQQPMMQQQQQPQQQGEPGWLSHSVQHMCCCSGGWLASPGTACMDTCMHALAPALMQL